MQIDPKIATLEFLTGFFCTCVNYHCMQFKTTKKSFIKVLLDFKKKIEQNLMRSRLLKYNFQTIE